MENRKKMGLPKEPRLLIEPNQEEGGVRSILSIKAQAEP
jgi:hypothetical protein